MQLPDVPDFSVGAAPDKLLEWLKKRNILPATFANALRLKTNTVMDLLGAGYLPTMQTAVRIHKATGGEVAIMDWFVPEELEPFTKVKLENVKRGRPRKDAGRLKQELAKVRIAERKRLTKERREAAKNAELTAEQKRLNAQAGLMPGWTPPTEKTRFVPM